MLKSDCRPLFSETAARPQGDCKATPAPLTPLLSFGTIAMLLCTCVSPRASPSGTELLGNVLRKSSAEGLLSPQNPPWGEA